MLFSFTFTMHKWRLEINSICDQITTIISELEGNEDVCIFNVWWYQVSERLDDQKWSQINVWTFYSLTSSPALFRLLLLWLLLFTCADWVAVTAFDEPDGITTLRFLCGNSSTGSFLLTMPETAPRRCYE